MAVVGAKEVATLTASNQQDGIHKALEHFGVLASEKSVCQSGLPLLIKSRPSTHMMDERTQEEPQAWIPKVQPTAQTLKLKN